MEQHWPEVKKRLVAASLDLLPRRIRRHPAARFFGHAAITGIRPPWPPRWVSRRTVPKRACREPRPYCATASASCRAPKPANCRYTFPIQAAKGAKITQTDAAHPVTFRNNKPERGHVESIGAPVKAAGGLSIQIPGPPARRTHPLGASIFAALTDRPGLRLESGKGPVQVYAVEKIEHPDKN